MSREPRENRRVYTGAHLGETETPDAGVHRVLVHARYIDRSVGHTQGTSHQGLTDSWLFPFSLSVSLRMHAPGEGNADRVREPGTPKVDVPRVSDLLERDPARQKGAGQSGFLSLCRLS